MRSARSRRGVIVRCFWRRRLLVMLVVIILIWVITIVNAIFIHYKIHSHRHRNLPEAEILQLSQGYVRALTKEHAGVVDGLYTGHFTDFDVKEGKTEQCELTDEDVQQFPRCREKLKWMRRMWKSDPCYEAHGVNGSDCSFVMYLSEVEGWCPRKKWTKFTLRNRSASDIYATVTTNLQGLLDLLKDPNERQGYAWIRLRVSRLWPKWVQAIHSLTAKQDLTNRPKQNVLIHMGLLSNQSGWKFAENQFKGGPLGELVQWSDLISVLYILGHQLTITSEVEQLVRLMSEMPKADSACQNRKGLSVSIIYTDIMGLKQFKKQSTKTPERSCLFRIVDSFGTEPAFNYRAFAKQNNILTAWGGQNLNPRQFFTMFPHSPDNSFMGFVVEHHLNDTVAEDQERRDIALVYGKNEYMWEGKRAYLDVISKYLEIHGTVFSEDRNNSKLPSYVINHGILSGVELHQLLRKAKIFVGLGFPYEGPAPLEAVAHGAVFLNPRFTPPRSRHNDNYFKGKPTEREVTSQHPYAEVFIGKPHVYTINITNLTEVQLAVKEALQLGKFTAFTPYEFTEEGMLQRMSAYIQHQQFCNFQHTVSKWPPASAVTVIMGQEGKTCAQSCWERDLICEPSYFLEINTERTLKGRSLCTNVTHSPGIYYPAVDMNKRECILQDNKMLFSCVGGKDSLRRQCPCRNYIPQQLALCKGCER